MWRAQREAGEMHFSWGMGARRREVVFEGEWRVRVRTWERGIASLGREWVGVGRVRRARTGRRLLRCMLAVFPVLLDGCSGVSGLISPW